MPTKLLTNPKNFAPLKPREDLNKTAKGIPNFCDGFPIKLQNIYTNNEPKIVPKKTTKVFKS